MRKSSSSTVLASFLLALAGLFSAASAQNKQPAVAPAQMAQEYASKKPIPAVLTLTANTQNAQPNQSIHFTLSWDRPVYRVTYRFDWGDGRTEDRADPAADHAYVSPGSYPVRVTARAIANTEIAGGKLQNVSIQSNAITIAVVLPQQPTVTLTPDKPNAAVDDAVVLVATPTPVAPNATYRFDFGDGIQPPDSNLNRIEHIYRTAGTFQARVTVIIDGEQWAASPPVEIIVTAPPLPPPALTVTTPAGIQQIAGNDIPVLAFLDPPQKNATLQFDWGDGATSSDVRPGLADHIYTATGSHTIVVTAGNTDQVYSPPLQGKLELFIRPVAPPPSLWPTIAAWATPIGILGFLVGLRVGRPKPRPPTPAATQPNPATAHQPFRYVAYQGAATHEIRASRPSRSLGPMTLSTGMDPAEHTITFHDHAKIPG
jgi:PKD repeat protein